MRNIVIASLALGVLASPAIAAGFPEKSEGQVYWKGAPTPMEDQPLAVVLGSDNFAGGYYSDSVTNEQFDSGNRLMHLPNR